jgi:hypothetical protein
MYCLIIESEAPPTVETKYEFVQRVSKYFVILYPPIKKYFPDKFMP